MNIRGLENIVSKLKAMETERRKIARMLRSGEITVSAIENKMIHKVKTEQLEKVKILAVDGGLSQQEYHGFNMVLVRSVGAVFEYDGILKRIAYYPSASPEPELKIIDNDDENISTSLIRQKNEVDTAIESVKRYSPDIVLMDGPITPYNRIKKGSLLHKTYSEVIESLKRLCSCPSLVIGCVEDSKGKEACKIISEAMKESNVDGADIIANTRDSVFLYNLLEQGERTFVFKRSEPVLEDLNQNVYSFYIKPAEFDRPLRVDFINPEDAERISSIIMCLYANNTYGFPIPLIEADMRAKLQEKDIEVAHDIISDMSGMPSSLMRLRRNIRPF